MRMSLTYRPLDVAIGEIRLLSIPVNSSAVEHCSTIHCHLEHVPIDGILRSEPRGLEDAGSSNSEEAPTWGHFTALSYEWGPLEPKQTIFVDEQPLQITVNLWRALHAVRQSFFHLLFRGYDSDPSRAENFGEFRLWVDAICINQSNIDERNLQVPRMRHIYAAACFVYCYLTPSSPSDEAEFCDDTHDRDMDFAVEAIQALREVSYSKDSRSELLCALQQQAKEISSDHWRALLLFFSNSYWNRLWIIQELALASEEVFILAGDRSIHWRHVRQVAWVMRRGYHVILDILASDSVSMGWTFVARLEGVQRNLRKAKEEWHPGLPLFDLVRYSRCTDLRDKVYGILGLVNSDLASTISVDYRKSIDEVYTDFAASIVRYTGTLEILGMSYSSPSEQSLLPSWVPDFRCEYATVIAPGGVNTEHMQKPLVRPVVTSHSQLLVGGIFLDEIDGLTATRSIQREHLRQDTDPDIVHASGLHRQEHVYEDHEGLKYAYWSTLVTKHGAKLDAAAISAPREVFEAQCSENMFGESVQEWLELNEDFEIAGHCLESFFASSPNLEAPSNDAEMQYKVYFMRLARRVMRHRLTFTRGGRLGLVPADSRKEDAIYTLHGFDSLAVLRRQADGWTFIGPCYIHGLMEGDHPAIIEGKVEEIVIS